MAILKSAIIFILIGYLIVLLPVLLRYQLQREKLKKPPVEPTNNSIIVDGHTYSLPSNLSPLNFTSYTHSIGFDGHPMESDSSPGIIRWTSNHEISDEQKNRERLLKNIQGKANKDPVKLKTRFELLKE